MRRRQRLVASLILVALPAFAGSGQPFTPGDVVATAVRGECGPHQFGNGFGAALYRRGSVWPSYFSDANFAFPVPNGPVTYSPVLNRMILGTYAPLGLGGTYTILETLDTDGHVTPLLTLPEKARVTALAGVGREILAVVVVYAPEYHFELWRIAATDGTATERIGLPLPLSVHDITSFDLAGDRCTLAYAVPGEVIHRYDICARRPLEDAATGPASAVHFLPQGNLLVSESLAEGPAASAPPWSRLTQYDREGRLVSTADLALGVESITAIALDPDGSTAWIATRYSIGGCFQGGRLIAVSASSGVLIAGPWGSGGAGLAVAGEWRAAEQPPARGRRAVRH